MPGTIVFIIVSALFGGAAVIKEKRVADEKAEIAKASSPNSNEE